MTKAELTALVERVERASGPDREIDRHIMSISYVWGERYIGCQCRDDGHDMCCPGGRHIEHVWIDPKTGQWKTTAREGYEFTSSLDAVIALIERELRPTHPHMTVSLRGTLSAPYDYWGAEITWPSHERRGRAPTAPLALLAAFLRAKLSQASE